MSNQQTLQQKRAAHAWDQIEGVKSHQKEYGSLVRGLPAMIQSDGLGQTLAFLKAKAGGKNDNHHAMVYNHLAQWVTRQLSISGDLIDWLIHQDSISYRQATAEVQAYVIWLKRFAEAKGWKTDEV